MDLVACLWGGGGEHCMAFRHSVGAYLELMPCLPPVDLEGPLEGGTEWVFCWSYRAGTQEGCIVGTWGSTKLEFMGPTLGISCHGQASPSG